jgi:Ca2+-dependent lipid-binding protein
MKCVLELKILDGTWKSDADMFGKQDPYVKWEYAKEMIQTTTKDDAGKEAVWNESFKLQNIRE